MIAHGKAQAGSEVTYRLLEEGGGDVTDAMESLVYPCLLYTSPLVIAQGMRDANMFDVVRVSSQRLIGEIIEMHGDEALSLIHICGTVRDQP